MKDTCIPFDKKILFLCVNGDDWLSNAKYREWQAIKDLLGDNLKFYGPGHVYNNNHIKDIISELYGSGQPDLIFCGLGYYTGQRLDKTLLKGIIHKFNIPPELYTFPVGLDSVDIPKMFWLEDIHQRSERWDQLLLENRFDFALCRYAPPFCRDNVFFQFFSQKAKKNVRFIPCPWSICPETFRDYGLEEVYDITLLGALFKEFYPLRLKMHQYFSIQNNIEYFNLPHPGYDFSEGRKHKITGVEYAKVINKSKIFATCNSIFKFPLKKVFEALGAKSALMCDPPSGADLLGLIPNENYIPVNANNFPQITRKFLSEPERLSHIAEQGHWLFLKRHTVQKRAEEFVRILEAIFYGKEAGTWMEYASLSKPVKTYSVPAAAQARPDSSSHQTASVPVAAGKGRFRITYLIDDMDDNSDENIALLKQARGMQERGHQVTIVSYSDRPAGLNGKMSFIRGEEDRPIADYIPPADAVITIRLDTAQKLRHLPTSVKLFYAQDDREADIFIEDSNKERAGQGRSDTVNSHVRIVQNSKRLADTMLRKRGIRVNGLMPVGVDKTSFHVPDKPVNKHGPMNILIVSGGHQPNFSVSAAEDAYKGVKLVRAIHPDISLFRISGSSEDPFAFYPCEFCTSPQEAEERRLYAMADIMVLADYRENCSRAPLKAMAAGAAVICPRTAGAVAYCQHGVNALLIPERSPKSLADALSLLLTDDLLRTRLVQGGYKVATEHPETIEWDAMESLIGRFVAGRTDERTGYDASGVF